MKKEEKKSSWKYKIISKVRILIEKTRTLRKFPDYKTKSQSDEKYEKFKKIRESF